MNGATGVTSRRSAQHSEKEIEQHLVRQIESLGGKCIKWNSRSTAGVPDRIVIFPNGVIWFVELKCATGELSLVQAYVLETLTELRCNCIVLDSKESVNEFCKRYSEDQ